MKIPKILFVWVVLLLGVLGVVVPGFAQYQNGTLRGVVLDQSGAVVPNAKVTATNENTGVEAGTTTTSAGVYTFPALLVGPYKLRVEVPGFKAYVRPGIQVLAAQVTDVTANLELGSVATEVVVESGANIVQTESSQISGTFEGRTLSEVPLVAGANLSVLNLAPYLPNTTTPAGGTSGNGGSVGGLRGRENSFTIDGVDNLDPTTTVSSQQVIPDAVQEFTLNQNVYSAEYGRGAGGQFNVITKSGTNTLHFGAWLYNINRAYDAADNQEVRNITLNQTDPTKGSPGKRRYDVNRVGGDIGAPIFKNKLFIYGAYEFNNTGQQATAPSGFAPTSAGMALINPLIVDSQAKALIAQFPVAPTQTLCGNPPTPCKVTVNNTDIPVGTVTTVAPSYDNKHDYNINGDWNLQKQSLHVRYLKDRERQPSFGSSFPQTQFASSVSVDNRRVIVNHVWTASSTLVNDFRGSFARYSQFFPLVGVAQSYPTLFIDDLPNTTIGPNGNLPQHRVFNEYLLGDVITKTLGRHTLKWGGQFYWFTSPSVFLSNERGQYDYATLNDLVNDSVPQDNNVTLQGIGNAFFAGNSRDFNVFVQDDVKVTPRLTLNLGLRYDYFGNAADMSSNALNSIADLPGTPLVFRNPKSDWNNVGPRLGFAWDPTGSGKWAVRGGAAIAYDVIPWNFYVNALPVERDVVLRPSTACAGSFSAKPSWCPGQANAGASFLATGAMKVTFIPPSTQGFARAQTANIIPDAVSPKVFSWSLSVQHEVLRETSVELRYLGTRAVELPLQLQLNSITAFENGAQPLPTYINPQDVPANVPASAPTRCQFLALQGLPPGPGPCPPNGAGRRYGAQGFLGAITDEAPSGNSTYHGGSIDVTHRTGHGLFLRANYTYSKVMDNGTNDVATSFVSPRRPQNPYNLHDEWARSALDATNKIALMFLYDTPKVPWDNRFARGALNGWTWSGAYLFQTGQPVTILSNVASNGNGDSAPGRAILNPSGAEGVGSLVKRVCASARPGPTSITNNTDSACAPANTVGYVAVNPNAKYIQAAAGAVTNLGRNTYTSPRTNSWNMGIQKAYAVTERFNLRIRLDATNVFNHPNYTLNQLGYVSFTTNALSGYSNLASVSSNTFLNAPALFPASTRTVQLGLKLTY
jgi:hypothetical protein